MWGGHARAIHHIRLVSPLVPKAKDILPRREYIHAWAVVAEACARVVGVARADRDDLLRRRG